MPLIIGGGRYSPEAKRDKLNELCMPCARHMMMCHKAELPRISLARTTKIGRGKWTNKDAGVKKECRLTLATFSSDALQQYTHALQICTACKYFHVLESHISSVRCRNKFPGTDVGEGTNRSGSRITERSNNMGTEYRKSESGMADNRNKLRR